MRRDGQNLRTDPKYTGFLFYDHDPDYELELLKKIKLEALLTIANTIERMEKKWEQLGGKKEVKRHFNMRFWCNKSDKIPHCGTAGCAIGTFINFNKRAANKLGLFLKESSHIRNVINFNLVDDIENTEAYDFDVIKKALNINYNAANYLFDPFHYVKSKRNSPSYVVHRIRTYVKAVKDRINELKITIRKLDKERASV